MYNYAVVVVSARVAEGSLSFEELVDSPPPTPLMVAGSWLVEHGSNQLRIPVRCSAAAGWYTCVQVQLEWGAAALCIRCRDPQVGALMCTIFAMDG